MATGLGPPPFWVDMYLPATKTDEIRDIDKSLGKSAMVLGGTETGRQMNPQWIAWFNKIYQLNK
jgi:hypothetical protein